MILFADRIIRDEASERLWCMVCFYWIFSLFHSMLLVFCTKDLSFCFYFRLFWETFCFLPELEIEWRVLLMDSNKLVLVASSMIKTIGWLLTQSSLQSGLVFVVTFLFWITTSTRTFSLWRALIVTFQLLQ